jgi:phage-related protein
MKEVSKTLVLLAGEIRTPPFSHEARIETGFLLRRLQRGEVLTLPHSRPMPSISPRCHELRIRDRGHNWRIVYRADPDVVLVAEVFDKKTQKTPQEVLETCRRRLRRHDEMPNEGVKR